MKRYTRVYASIDLDAVVFNMESMQQKLAPGTGMIGVVKTDGYGHGAVPVALAIAPYVQGYAVASIDEALILRRHGIRNLILVLGVTHPSRYEELVTQEIRPAVFTLEQARALSEQAVKLGRTARIHLAVDTGMGRIGMCPDEAGAREAAQIAALPGIETEGLFTHFARADETDKASALEQLARYQTFVSLLEKKGVPISMKHCSNSAAILELEAAHLDLVRAGISIYGMYPSGKVRPPEVVLKPVMGLKSAVTYVKHVEAGQPISYGGTFVAPGPMRVATVPVGYGDGYPRGLSGKGYVLIAGKRAPVLGRICMDQFMVDVTEIPEAEVDSEVTLLGRDGDAEITVEELADLCGRFHYEFVCCIGKRVPRVYYRNGRMVGTKDYFEDLYQDFLPDDGHSSVISC